MKVLLLGGDGFIGAHLLQKHILCNDECTVLDINNIRTRPTGRVYRYIKHDISTGGLETILSKVKPDLVYNCIAVATPSFYVKHPTQTFELDFLVNYEHICKPLLKTNTPFVHFSTSEVYGKRWESKYKEFKSDLIIGPVNKSRWIYATSKILLEQLLMSSSNNNFVIVRPQNFCGWDMDWLPDMNLNQDKKWIPRLPACFINALFYSKNIMVVKPGSQKRCYTYIDDAIEGIYSIVQNWESCSKVGKLFNIGNPDNEMSIKNLAKLYQTTWERLTGKKPSKIKYVSGRKYYGEGYEDSERRLFSNKRIKQFTGWEASVGISQTVEFVISNAIANYNIK
jgi:nucleoside-diphosphate-sugar epimerase